MGGSTENTPAFEERVVATLKRVATPLETTADLDPLMERIGDARVVMLGEASHGTHEYYTWRSRITKRLILEKGFNFIAVEGDWPDCYRINRYIKGDASEKKAVDVVRQFHRWPTWMWANWEVIALTEWLYQYNWPLAIGQKIGFYGLDVYSLWDSLHEIRAYLQENDPGSLAAAEKAFRCFHPYKDEEGISYAKRLRLVPQTCETEVINLLTQFRQRMGGYDHDPENIFSTEQNALVAINAEKYYRSMLEGGAASWNVRDQHMQETLERLLDFHGTESKAIVWEHNTHIGDARATDMTNEGMVNIGELARTRFGIEEVVLVGFGSYQGTVVAGKSWGAEMQEMPVPEAVAGSWEDLMHQAGGNKLLLLDDLRRDLLFASNSIGHRAIGVVYNPAFEQYGNYVPSIMPLRYDAFIHIDTTRALHPLRVDADEHEMPDTYPFGE
ncbi:MAG TPA: erythromycin esterase family protein [Chitinophagaceae bacterium]|nr:erythromycin esterase family protein [Chitinophagaceae bacterium]